MNDSRLHSTLREWRTPMTAQVTIVALGGGVVVVALVSELVLGIWPSKGEWPLFLGNIFLIAMVIVIVTQVASEAGHRGTTYADNGLSPLLDRLPSKKRGTPPALSAENNHLRDGYRTILTLSDEHEFPASRRYVAANREAGLLPK